jgi:two-component system heavy metal sensor histidine kinase CusS
MSLRRSIAARLAAMFALAALLVFALVGWSLHRALVDELRQHQRQQVDTQFQDVAYFLRRLRQPEQWPRLHAKLDALTPPDHSTQYWILSDDPQIRYGSELAEIVGLSPDSLDSADAPDAPVTTGEIRLGSQATPVRMMMRSEYFPAEGGRAAFRFIVGIDSASYGRTRRAFESALLALCSGGVLLVALMGYLIAHWGLLPLKRLTDEAHRLSPSTLSQRLAVAPLPSELSDLAISFNGALDRLEAAYQQLEGFNADVTHELRTPLANLIGQTQVALSRPRPVAELEEVLHSNLEELERLRSIVNDMLFLARADQGERPQRLVPTSLAAEVKKTVEFLDLVMDEAGVRVRVQGDAEAPIDPSLFGRAVTNLLHNAIRHSEARSEIVVNVHAEPTQARHVAWVAVSNPGPAIAPEHLGRLFDRFYRVDSARTNSTDNHGLGLAIVKAVARMHAGEVFAASQGGMTTVGFSVGVG